MSEQEKWEIEYEKMFFTNESDLRSWMLKQACERPEQIEFIKSLLKKERVRVCDEIEHEFTKLNRIVDVYDIKQILNQVKEGI